MADERPASTPALPWTGERYVPEVGGQLALEHLHRYVFAAELAHGKDVLDIACGEGYGSAMLAAHANAVTGVDISPEVIAHATERYRMPNLSFIAGTCHKIPLKAASVHLVVSFETIEHVDQHEKMLKEIKRVLRPRGTLILSSPEKSQYSDAVEQSNPFHVKELYDSEFRALISAHFKHVAFGGQRIVFGSGILMENLAGGVRTYTWKENATTSAEGMASPRYLIAIASDGALPCRAGGVFEQPINDPDIVQGWAKAVAERDEQIAKLNAALSEPTKPHGKP